MIEMIMEKGISNQLAKDLYWELTNIWIDYHVRGNKETLVKFANKLLTIKEENGNSIDFLPDLTKEYASDCFVLLGQYQYAVDFFPIPALGSCASWGTDKFLSLKYVTKNRISGKEILSLIGPKVTRFGKEYLEDILSNLNILIESLWSKTKVDYISEWASQCIHSKYQVGNGNPIGYFLTKNVEIEIYRFSYNRTVRKFADNLTREAENMVREKLAIPKVGEGWIAETILYYEIKKAFPELEVQQHAKPDWLGRQHLDIFIPRKNVALEYQGLQHDQPVDYFGGQDTFEKNKKRDERKYRVCKRHNIKLIYVRPLYDLKSIIKDIESEIYNPGVNGFIG